MSQPTPPPDTETHLLSDLPPSHPAHELAHPPATAALDALEYRSAAEAMFEPEAPTTHHVGWGFISLYSLAYMGTWLALLSPVLVTLSLKVNALVGTAQGPASLGLVAGVGALLALVANPFFGKLSDRTTSRLGMRRPWMVLGLAGGAVGLFIVAVAPSIPVVLFGWCIAQLAFNALLAATVAVLPDQVPPQQRGLVSGVLGVCTPLALVGGSYVVQLVAPNQIAMFLFPVAIGGFFVLLFALTLKDRRLDPGATEPWSLREFAKTFYVNPRRNPDFAWAWLSRFLFVLAYAFLVTYQAFYLLDQIGSSASDVPRQIFLGTLVQAVVVIGASIAGGKLSDLTGRRKIFVLVAAVVYGMALFVIAAATGFNGFLVGMAISGLGFGVYVAVDLALVADVLPNKEDCAKDLGVFNIASAGPQSLAPAIAPAILAVGGGSYGVLYAVAGACAVLSALAILKVRGVR